MLSKCSVVGSPVTGANPPSSKEGRPDEKWVLVRNGTILSSDVKDNRFGVNGVLDQTSQSSVTTQNDPAIPAGQPAQMALAIPRMLGHPSLRGARSSAGKNGLIRVTLWQKIAQSQSTTALVTASALQPASATAYSEFSTLYDEARCLGMTFHCRAISGTAATIDSWAVAFDPSISGNTSSIITTVEHKYHLGPLAVPTSASGASTDGVASSTGFHRFSAKTVKVFVSGTTNDVIGSNWYSSSVTSGIVGYLKPYVENTPAGTVYCTTYVAYDMEFKYRG